VRKTNKGIGRLAYEADTGERERDKGTLKMWEKGKGKRKRKK
jgi:hypothetical protein